VICITGKMNRGTRKQVQAVIVSAGGRTIGSVGATCNILISTPVEIEKKTVKVNTARGQGIPIVSEAWLDACLDEGDQVDPSDYSLVEGGGGGGGGARAPSRGPAAGGRGGGGSGSADAEPAASPVAAPPRDRGNRLGGGAGNVPGGRSNPRMAALLAAERRIGGGGGQEAAETEPAAASEQSAGSRICSACTFENEGAGESCTMCGGSLDGAAAAAAPARADESLDDSINLADSEDDDEDMRRAIALSKAEAVQPTRPGSGPGSTSSSSPGSGSSERWKRGLPYGGDIRQATKAHDRDAIRRIMTARPSSGGIIAQFRTV